MFKGIKEVKDIKEGIREVGRDIGILIKLPRDYRWEIHGRKRRIERAERWEG